MYLILSSVNYFFKIPLLNLTTDMLEIDAFVMLLNRLFITKLFMQAICTPAVSASAQFVKKPKVLS